MVAHPLLAITSCPSTFGFSSLPFSFQGGLYCSSSLVWDFPPALGRADLLSASSPSDPSLPLALPFL